jgi:acyl carrier protein
VSVPLDKGIPVVFEEKTMMTLTPEKIHEVIWTLAAKHSDKDLSEIRPESRLIQDLGADSLTVVEFSMELEEELGLTFPDSVLDKPNLTMADVEKAVQDLASKT